MSTLWVCLFAGGVGFVLGAVVMLASVSWIVAWAADVLEVDMRGGHMP